MKKFIRLLSILLFILLFVGTLVFLYFKSRPQPRPVRTVSPVYMDIVQKTVATGTLLARREVEIKPQLSGVIDELFVETGDTVKKGQVLAKIRLIPNLVRINDAEARVTMASISLEDAEKTHRRVEKRFKTALKNGMPAEDGQSPNLIKLNRAEAELKQADLTLTDAEDDYRREKRLLTEKVVSQSSFQDTSILLSKARDAQKKALAYYEMVVAATVDDTEEEFQKAEMDLRQAREELAAANNNLQLIREGITEATSDKTNTLVRATIDGMVLELPVKEGANVVETSIQSSGTTIAVVADMADMIFEGNLDETEIGKIQAGMPLVLTIGAIDNETFEAEIEHIAPKGKEISGTIQFGLRAKVIINDHFFIRSGYSASADIVLEKQENVMAVEEGNILFQENGLFVERQTEPGSFEKRKIETGLSDGIHIEVVSGLTAGDRIKVQD